MKYYGYTKKQTITEVERHIRGQNEVHSMIDASVTGECAKYIIPLKVRDIITLFSIGERCEPMFQDRVKINGFAKSMTGRDADGLVNPMLSVAFWKDKATFYNIESAEVAGVDLAGIAGGISTLSIDWSAYRDSILTAAESHGFFYNATARMGLVLDGYQRLYGAIQAGKYDYVFSVILYLVEPSEVERLYRRIHEDDSVNSQYKNAFKYEFFEWFNVLAGEDDANNKAKSDIDAALLAIQLNEESELFSGRIKSDNSLWNKNGSGKRPLVKLSAMEKLLNNWLTGLRDIADSYPEFSFGSDSEKIKLLDDYFGAWRQCWPYAWLENEVNPPYMMTKTTGITILFMLFVPITLKALRNKYEITMEGYAAVLKSLYFESDKQTPITLHFRDKEILLDWKSEVFSEFSSGQGRSILYKKMLECIY